MITDELLIIIITKMLCYKNEIIRDDKRFILENGIYTTAHGHYSTGIK